MIRHDLNVSSREFNMIHRGWQTHFICKREQFHPQRPPELADVLDLREFVSCSDCKGCGRVRSNDGREMEDCGCALPHGRLTGRVLSALITSIEYVDTDLGGVGLSPYAMSVRLVGVGEGGNESAALRAALMTEMEKYFPVKPMTGPVGKIEFYSPRLGSSSK